MNGGSNLDAVLLLLVGFNDNAALRYVQLFGGNPNPGDTPTYSFLVPGKSNFSFSPYVDDINSGLLSVYWIASSLTPITYTNSGTLDLWYTSHYGQNV